MSIEETTVAIIQQQLQAEHALCEQKLLLNFGRAQLQLESNSRELIALLKQYFSACVTESLSPSMDTLKVMAIERSQALLNIEFNDWLREPGKTGRKDSYFDIADGRVLRKVRTGMVFVQSQSHCMAAGPCIKHNNQLINFINSQYMNWLQQRGWLICHASALSKAGKAVAIAGLSGGGKSSLMLDLLDNSHWQFLTNDRLLIHTSSTTSSAAGIPKLPRINPGTIIHNPRLHPLLNTEQHTFFSSMSKDELWEHEEKYDVDIERFYGSNRITQEALLSAFIVLNWEKDTSQATELKPVVINHRLDLLSAIMKSAGPFYQKTDGSFNKQDPGFDTELYTEALANIAVYELSGHRDFARACELIETELGNR